MFCLFFFFVELGLNLGLCTCEAVTLLLLSHLQSILFWLLLLLLFFGDEISGTICLAWSSTVILLISASQVTRIIDVSPSAQLSFLDTDRKLALGGALSSGHNGELTAQG
jgi:hypothetical protein